MEERAWAGSMLRKTSPRISMGGVLGVLLGAGGPNGRADPGARSVKIETLNSRPPGRLNTILCA